MTSPTPQTKWRFEADYLQGCNCDYGCPCEFEAPPTRGYCEGLGAWHIIKGHHGDLALDGLALAFVARWPKAIHQGNGTAALFFDERADQRQRDALVRIASGQEGGMPFELIVQTFTKVLPPQFVPIHFDLRGRDSRVTIGKVAGIALEPIKNPVTGSPETVRVNHETGFIFKNAEAVSAKECRAEVEELTFTWPDKAGFFARIQYGN
jgi:hypothetical protein